MERGYIKLWRKIDDCEALKELGKVFSRLEAWIDIVMNQARGIDDGDLKRGEFEASYRYLAKRWNWSLGKVQRFVSELQKEPEPMLKRVIHSSIQQTIQQTIHFSVCKYDTYNPTRYTDQYTERYSKRYKLKEGINKGSNEGKESSQAGACSVDPSPSEIEAARLSELLRSRIALRDGEAKAGKLPVPPGWIEDIEKMIRIDNRKPEDIEKVIEWCQREDCFWAPNILSGRKLRDKFDTMRGQMKFNGKMPTTSKAQELEQAAKNTFQQLLDEQNGRKREA